MRTQFIIYIIYIPKAFSVALSTYNQKYDLAIFHLIYLFIAHESVIVFLSKDRFILYQFIDERS